MTDIKAKFVSFTTNMSSNIYILGESMGYPSDNLIEKSKANGRYVCQGNGAYVLYEEIKN